MPNQRRAELEKHEDYWFFDPKSCPAYQAMLSRPKEEVKELTKELKDAPMSTLVAIKGIRSSDNLIEFLGSLLADVTLGAVPPDDAMACLSISDKIIEVARFSLQEPRSVKGLGSSRPLTLAGGD